MQNLCVKHTAGFSCVPWWFWIIWRFYSDMSTVWYWWSIRYGIIIFLHNSLMIPFSQISSKSHSSIAFMDNLMMRSPSFSWLMILLINIREICVLIESLAAKWKRALEKKYNFHEISFAHLKRILFKFYLGS